MGAARRRSLPYSATVAYLCYPHLQTQGLLKLAKSDAALGIYLVLKQSGKKRSGGRQMKQRSVSLVSDHTRDVFYL